MPLPAIIAILLVSFVFLLVGLAGCSKSTSNDPPAQPEVIHQADIEVKPDIEPPLVDDPPPPADPPVPPDEGDYAISDDALKESIADLERKLFSPAAEVPDDYGPKITADDVSHVSKEVFLRMLKDLQLAIPPAPRQGAMCYSMMIPPGRYEYVCPECGEKTIYADANDMPVERIRRLWGLVPYCRRMVSEIPKLSGVTVTLDESELCSHCSPDAETPSPAIVVRYKHGRTHRVEDFDDCDVRILISFLSGELDYERQNGFTEPLKKQIPRIRELLGLDNDEEEETADESASAAEEPVTAEAIAATPRETLYQLLADFKQNPPSESSLMQRTCYMSTGPSRTTYVHVCPDCLERTVYTEPGYPRLFGGLKDGRPTIELTRCQRVLESMPKIEGLTMTIDLSELCSHCKPEIETPALILVVKYNDGETHRVSPIQPIDLEMLQSLLNGEKTCDTRATGKFVLVRKIPRLYELLGLEEDEDTTSDETNEL